MQRGRRTSAPSLILDGNGLLDPRALRATVSTARWLGRLHLVPRFRQRVVRPRRGLGGPIWVDDAAFELGDHVKVRELPAGSQDDALLRAAEAIRRQRLDMARPLWEAWLLPGLSRGRVGLFLRIHHVIGDGRAALTMLGALVDTDPASIRERPAAMGPGTTAPGPGSVCGQRSAPAGGAGGGAPCPRAAAGLDSQGPSRRAWDAGAHGRGSG